MTPAPKKPTSNFTIDTETFCEIWSNHIGVGTKSGSDDWRRFVLNIYKRFTDNSEQGKKNHDHMKQLDAKWKSWSEDRQYDHINKKAYAKCITIQRKLKKEEDFEIDLPAGYKDRNGGKSKRVSTKKLMGIFKPK